MSALLLCQILHSTIQNIYIFSLYRISISLIFGQELQSQICNGRVKPKFKVKFWSWRCFRFQVMNLSDTYLRNNMETLSNTDNVPCFSPPFLNSTINQTFLCLLPEILTSNSFFLAPSLLQNKQKPITKKQKNPKHKQTQQTPHKQMNK